MVLKSVVGIQVVNGTTVKLCVGSEEGAISTVVSIGGSSLVLDNGATSTDVSTGGSSLVLADGATIVEFEAGNEIVSAGAVGWISIVVDDGQTLVVVYTSTVVTDASATGVEVCSPGQFEMPGAQEKIVSVSVAVTVDSLWW